jgi:Dolichyl-phosphate-mannose-protein mannosyltransferase
MLQRVRRLLLAAALLCFALAAIVALRGRVDFFIAHRRLPIRGIALPGVLAWMFVLGAIVGLSRQRRDRIAESAASWVRAHSTALAIAIAVATLMVGVGEGAFVAAGSDPYGYVSQADLWTAGNPVQTAPLLAIDAPWPDPVWSFSPLGYRPGIANGTIVPTYAIGLPLQMAAAARLFGSNARYAIVPLLGAASVWIAFAIARRAAGPVPACLAALLTACNPTFLFQVVQPMSDVPAATWWLACVGLLFGGSLAAALAAGAAASLAILTRPNTVPLMLGVLFFVWFGPETTALKIKRVAVLVVGVLPGLLITAWANAIFFGSAFQSGYGTLGDIYDRSRLAEMGARYVREMWGTYTPLAFAAFLAWRSPIKRLGSTASAFTLILLGSYASYSVFDLRFLLPATTLLVIASTAAIAHSVARFSLTVRGVLFGMAATLLPLAFIHRATHDDVFRLKEIYTHRFKRPVEDVRPRLPTNAAIFTIVESGSFRYYGGYTTLRFDWIPETGLDAAVGYLVARQHPVYFAGAADELNQLETRFATSRIVRGLPSFPASRSGEIVFLPLVGSGLQ